MQKLKTKSKLLKSANLEEYPYDDVAEEFRNVTLQDEFKDKCLR